MYGFGVLFLAIVSLGFSPTARAATNWQSDALSASETNIPSFNIECNNQSISIGGPGTATKDICVYQADNWQYGIYSTYTQTGPNSWDGYSTNRLVVGFMNEQAMYVVEGVNVDNQITFVAHSNHFIFDTAAPDSNNERQVSIIKNLPSKLQKIGNEYRLKAGAIEPLLSDENGHAIKIKAVGASENGQWLSVLQEKAGLVRINLQTFEKRWFSKYTVDRSAPHAELSIPMLIASNDGQYITRSGAGIPMVISDISGDCGINAAPFRTSWVNNPGSAAFSSCHERDVGSVVNEGIGGGLIYGYLAKISDNNDEIIGVVLRYLYDDSGRQIAVEWKWFNLHKTGHNFPLALDYLALGDSFSSGEGDTEKDENGNKYYRPWTDNNENKPAGIPREKCHISTRSYPYKLAEDMGLTLNNKKEWDTVTCSGARVVDIIPEDRASDRGQDNQLAGYDHASLKTIALNEMIPGRVKQINFVKKYKPKVITLTIGGNDVGFGHKIAECAGELITCDIANGSKEDIASEIRGQYDDFRDLYQKLYEASDYKTKIYVLGYPQFINGDSTAPCAFNTGALNSSEREMIENSVIYMNNVIEMAAKSVGVKYIDAEASLVGHRLCDFGDKYVTGVTNLLRFNGNEEPESFHPNARGHDLIAAAVQGVVGREGLINYDTCPGIEENVCPDTYASVDDIQAPSYFHVVKKDKNIHHKQVTDFEQFVGKVIDVSTGVYSFASNSIVGLFIHSDPIDLGQFETLEDGSLRIKATIPSSLPAGYHTVKLKGTSFSGEPVEYEQTILVQGANPNDRDDDGVPDASDPCLFVPHANVDYDQDNQDDACDPEITNPPLPKEPYRIRAGVPSKSYAGQPEDSKSLYLERNVHATQDTGVRDDYDHDRDGWVVVATNRPPDGSSNVPAEPPVAAYARFWLEDVTRADGSTVKIPHISFRTQENGCVEYLAADLSVLTQENSNIHRGFTKKAEDTAICRSEPPGADTDSNGQPDNEQALYRARSGNPGMKHTRPDGTSFFEDVKQLYLERNSRAAEAQLGKSDYAVVDVGLLPAGGSIETILPTDTKDYRQAWSLIAISNNPSYFYVPIYKKLHTINGQLYVLAATSPTSYSQCLAYKPQSLATIGRNSQYTRMLQLDFMQSLLQGGTCQ